MVDCKVTDYQESDFNELIGLWTRTHLGGPERADDSDVILRTIRHGGRLILLRDADDHVIGSSWITHDGRRSWIHHFCIDPDFQGKGLSYRLMDQTMDIVRSLGFQVKLEVHHDNEAALHLYKKYGFKELEGYLVYMIR